LLALGILCPPQQLLSVWYRHCHPLISPKRSEQCRSSFLFHVNAAVHWYPAGVLHFTSGETSLSDMQQMQVVPAGVLQITSSETPQLYVAKRKSSCTVVVLITSGETCLSDMRQSQVLPHRCGADHHRRNTPRRYAANASAPAAAPPR
jgi:hypothetical protein